MLFCCVVVLNFLIVVWIKWLFEREFFVLVYFVVWDCDCWDYFFVNFCIVIMIFFKYVIFIIVFFIIFFCCYFFFLDIVGLWKFELFIIYFMIKSCVGFEFGFEILMEFFFIVYLFILFGFFDVNFNVFLRIILFIV